MVDHGLAQVGSVVARGQGVSVALRRLPLPAGRQIPYVPLFVPVQYRGKDLVQVGAGADEEEPVREARGVSRQSIIAISQGGSGRKGCLSAISNRTPVVAVGKLL